MQLGFTYIWVLLLVALMGVGLTVAAELQTTAIRRDKERELLAIGGQFRTALASYHQARMPALGPPAGSGTSAGTGVSAPPAAGGNVVVPGTAPQGSFRSDPLSYPATLEDLLKDDRFPGIRRHLRKIFVDPMTGKAEWGLVKVSGRIVGIHSLSTKVPIKLAGFEGEDHAFNGARSYASWVFGPAGQLASTQPPISQRQ
ncbi:type II secretion system protein [Variovorax sp. Sphag1AA]|uniref:type II secretion system protein n=1 Tax=Variovorax sp. Sphag1AA TaxID=2587027 RepID=UPI00160F322F|nr:type II secretion system protein [Variovorax sp. Sphag1AA]MBB3176031.1 type II secretory pathway pseudopilin PulG [Variovorax sp. Sphag1AA]